MIFHTTRKLLIILPANEKFKEAREELLALNDCAKKLMIQPVTKEE